MKHGWLFIVATAALLAGCSGIRVHQDYDPGSDFSALSTYQWASEPRGKIGDPRLDNPLRDARIRTAIERVLHAKGHDLSRGGTDGFRVRYQYTLRRKLESGGASGGIGFGVGSFGRRGGIALGTGDTLHEYDEETLSIDFVKEDSDSLLWRGTGSQRLVEYDDPAKSTKAVNTLVEKILDQFPPPKEKK